MDSSLANTVEKEEATPTIPTEQQQQQPQPALSSPKEENDQTTVDSSEELQAGEEQTRAEQTNNDADIHEGEHSVKEDDEEVAATVEKHDDTLETSYHRDSIQAAAEEAVNAATAFIRSDSVLSLDVEMLEDDALLEEEEDQHQRCNNRNPSILYMEEASMEARLEATPNLASENKARVFPSGKLGYRHPSNEAEASNWQGRRASSRGSNTRNDSISDLVLGEVGSFEEGTSLLQKQQQPVTNSSTAVTPPNDEAIPEGKDAKAATTTTTTTPMSTEEVLKSCGILPLSLEQLSRLHRLHGEQAVVKALMETQDETATPAVSLEEEVLLNTNSDEHLVTAEADDEVLLLHSLFATFCTPPPSLESVRQILNMERSHCSGNDVTGWKQQAIMKRAAQHRPYQMSDGNSNDISHGDNDKVDANDEAATPLSNTTNTTATLLAKDVLVPVSGAQKSSIITLLCCQPEQHLLRLPTPFQLAFFRILVRLLTNETDDEYNDECLLTCDWWDQGILEKEKKSQNDNTDPDKSATESNGNGNRNGGKSVSSSTQARSTSILNPSFSSESLNIKSRDKKRIGKMRKRRKQVDRLRSRQSSIDARLAKQSLTTQSRMAEKRPNQIYKIVRFRSGAAWTRDSSPKSNASSNLDDAGESAVTVLLRLLVLLLEGTGDAQKKQYPFDHLLAPVTRLLGLSCTAGVSVKELRHMLFLAARPLRESANNVDEEEQSEQSETTFANVRLPAFEWLLLVRALSTAAEGATQSTQLVGKASPRYFFTFGRGPGLVRNMRSLSAWPFRNDFGMAVWFRAESFDALNDSPDSTTRHSTLLSVRTECGGGIEVSLIPLSDLEDEEEQASSPSGMSNVNVLAVTVYNSHSDEIHRVVLNGCLLLPRVWYHVAVRHTRSRLKGVFSMATRQQVSIMLDGKLMLKDVLQFPRIADLDKAAPGKVLPLLRSASTSKESGLNVTIKFASNFDGQTGALYVFNDHISESTLRALFEATAGTGGITKQEAFSDKKWDSQLARKVSAYGEMTNADAEEIVVTRQESESSGAASFNVGAIGDSTAEVVDMGEGENQEDSDLPPELSKASLGSKVFLVWDPKRTEGSVALELHSGAHVEMDLDKSQPWYVDGAKNVIASIGGVQAILPLFHVILSGDVEKYWQQENAKQIRSETVCIDIEENLDEAILYTMVPDLLSLIASFIRDHPENAREMLRCGGIDIVEQHLLKNKMIGAVSSKRQSTISLMSVLGFYPGLSNRLVDSLLDLRSACSPSVGLETKVFTRLLFNIPLWFGGASHDPGVALHSTLLPVLSCIAKSSPKKVRDCVGTKDMIESLREYTSVGDTVEATAQFSNEPETVLFDRSCGSGLSVIAPLTINERRGVVGVMLGMVASVMAPGTSFPHVSPLLNYISYNLDSEWEQASLEIKAGNGVLSRKGSREEKYLATTKACMLLLFLLQGRPVVPGLFESLAECCGGVHGFASWLLCALVNSFDDSVRSVGIRCLNAFLDVTAPNPESVLSLTTTPDGVDSGSSQIIEGFKMEDSPKTARNILSATMENVGKGLAVIGNAGVLANILPPSKLSVKIIYKLLWHLLKCHRTRIGQKTRAALVQLLLDDRMLLSSSASSHINEFVVPDDVLRNGYKMSPNWADASLSDACSVSNQKLRDTPAISTVLRLLRFLPEDMKERWVLDMLMLVTTSPSSLDSLFKNPDWQSCLFHFVSEIVEEISAYQADGTGVAGYNSISAPAVTDGSSHNVGNLTEDSSDRLSSQTKPGADNENSKESLGTQSASDVGNQSIVQQRFDLTLKLYSALLGHSIRQGGDKAFREVEQAASLQRVCVNGHEVFSLVLSHLLADLIEHGTVLNIESLATSASGPPDERNRLLKQSARIVTNAILSNGTDGMDMASAVRQWRSLRHLSAVIVAVIAKSGFGVAELFDYRNQHASALDSLSGGFHGIRLSGGNVLGISANDCISGSKFNAYSSTQSDDRQRCERENYRRVCVTLSCQLLSLLDAFIFPDSLDASLPASQLHGLALVRSSEPRLGMAQGPLLASLMRLSLLLLCHLEPSSVKFLQCCSRLRCFMHWALELIRESVALAGYSAAFHDLTATLDRLVLAVVLHCHRALARCSAVLFEIEASKYWTYFPNEETKKKNYRRLFRVVLELREIVLATYRGRNEVLRAALSLQAFEALQAALEKTSSNQNHESDESGTHRSGGVSSKETVIRDFLSSSWVTGFHDVEMVGNLAVPEQVANGQVYRHKTASHRGLLAVEELASESKAIVEDFDRGLDAPFEAYCENQRQWADTDAVRDVEYEGDMIVKRLSGKHRSDLNETNRLGSLRLDSAKNRWNAIEREVSELWSRGSHWKLAEHTDRLSRRVLFVRNRFFRDHREASYELMLEKEREKANRDREERLRKKQQELSELVRRNESAFVPYGEAEEGEAELEEDENQAVLDNSNEGGHADSEGVSEFRDADQDALEPHPDVDAAADDEWNHVDVEEEVLCHENKDSDAWAKAFIWSDSESIVARFDGVTVVTLQTLTEGRLLLTTHGLYFHPTGDEVNVMTKEVFVRSETDMALAKQDRRWRLGRLTEVHGRRYMLRAQALELFFSDTHELFLNFSGGIRERDRFYAKLRNSCKVPMLWSIKSLNPRVLFKKSRATELWRKRKISNFQYLMQLNKMAGRTFNDITQYPVFPWVLVDYTSEELDLNDSRVFRDLTKPVGALNPDRLARLIERYNDLEAFGVSENEKFLYGSHYSSPGVALHYLIRQEPFTTMLIELQSGRFDCPDRLFFDVAGCWKSCLTSTSDVKELIPEFFTCAEMFLNTNNYPLGHTQDAQLIHDVILPPWAKGSAHEFVRIHRLALESEYVSQNLNHWIDLVFGYKQRGSAAEAAHNIFHHLSYEGAVDLDKITDEVDRMAAESHIQNFGQTPCQLLVKLPHPRRYSAEECWKLLIDNLSVPKQLRCRTPAKQFGGKRSGNARGAVVSIHVMTDVLVAVYADLSLGTYKLSQRRNGVSIKMDKLRTLTRGDLSTSRAAIKRGKAAPQTMESIGSRLAVGNWSFGMTVGGSVKANLRRKAAVSRLNTKDPLGSVEASSLLVSCGYWDNTVKVHSIDGSKLRCSETGGHRGPILCLGIGDDGALMVTGGQDATCRVWVVDHPDMAIALSDGYVKTALGESADDSKEQLLSCCHVLWGHETAVTCLSLSSDLDVTVSGSVDGNICVHTIRRGKFIRSIRPGSIAGTGEKQSPAVRKLALDSHGTFVAHMEDGGLHAYTINGFHLCSTDAGEKLHDMIICSGGEMLVTGGDGCHVVVRTVHNLQVHSMLDLSRHGPIRCISLTPDELNPIPQFLFIGSDDGMITVVDRDPHAGDEDTETVTFGEEEKKKIT